MIHIRNQQQTHNSSAPFNTSVKIIIVAFFIALSFLILPKIAFSESKLPNIPYVLVDAADNTVIAQNRLHERWHPASLTKLMTAYVTFRAIKDGEITAGSPVTFTKKAARTPPGKMGYKAGTKLRFDMALYTLIVKSANDVAVALAESLAGNVPAFVDRMNFEAKRLGLTNTNFVNPNGLHNSNQYVSARDLVILSSAIWNEFPQYRELFETPTITAGKKHYTSYNFLLERFDGTTGMKTGFICASGYNIVASAERNGKRLVAVVLGSQSQTERAEIAAQLLLKGFANPSGTAMTDMPAPIPATGPKNMRPILCTKKARESRYDPASHNAIIKSPFLHARQITRKPFSITLGNIDGEPSPAWLGRAFKPAKVPVPTKRPNYVIVNVDGDQISSSSLRGTVAIPQKRPKTGSLVQ